MVIAQWLKAPIKFAHEVYVLTPQQISSDKQAAKVNVFDVLHSSHDLKLFILYGLGIAASLAGALYLKSKPFFQRVGEFIDKATYFAPDVIRVSLGAALIAGAYFHAVFGPELPINGFIDHQLIEPFLLTSGVAITLGFWTRIFGTLVALFWLLGFWAEGWYMLTYLNYFGEAVALVLIPRQNFSLDRLIFKHRFSGFDYSRWAMPVARVMFGVALLYAAINVKFVTAKLSVDVVTQYHLTNYFHFDPMFVVLGAGMVECLMALLFMFGLLQRLNSLAFIGFIAASLLFFKEAVWPHYLLLGLAAGIFLHKPDYLALDSRLFRRKHH